MSDLIRLVKLDIESALSEVKTTANALEADYATTDLGENVLEMAEKFVEINQTLTTVLKTYQELLIHNEAATKQLIETMEQTEERVASQIQVQMMK